MKSQKILIIGSGIGGIASAIRLAARGYQVTVLEKMERPGGKMGQIKESGFRFDTGPSLFTLPHLMNELLHLNSPIESHDFKYKKLENICRYFFEDGTEINALANPLDFAGELHAKTGEKEDHLLNYLNRAKTIFNSTADLFIFNPLHRFLRLAMKTKPSHLKNIFTINPLRTMHRENKKWFRSKHVIQIFDRFATYHGSSPYLTSSIYNMIPHLEHNIGAFFPEKGMYNIVEVLYRKAIKLGVEFRFNTEVTDLLTQGTKVTGVKAENEILKADIVISDMDIHMFYSSPGKRLKKPQAIKKRSLSSSAVIFYWGMKKQFPQLDLHNILFSKNYQDEFDALFNRQELWPDPTVYIFISSKIVPADAPEGCENWFVMINVPPFGAEFNREYLLKAKHNIINKIKRLLNIDPSPHIVFEKVATPATLEANSGAFRGALYGNNANNIQSAFLKHQNRSSQYKNLFFTGGTVHPGGGIPLCLASAQIVEKEIERM
ncbi:1-hydroxycarotenoid 3,4-desaturase CrtD [Thermophagus sp. OGC60D27]|uniref:1-hydroxycarotenoid 3,4-desaturase CrtD n=1 Tax=Thermophagus sp. OGC60D27 TaxID=3458415 RepID=UPI00403836AA